MRRVAWIVGMLTVAVAGSAQARGGFTPEPPPTLPGPPTKLKPTPAPLQLPIRGAMGQSPDDQLLNDALQEYRQGNMVRARKSFYELIKNHPRSPHVPSAYVVFGDYYFNQNSMANARRFYERVVRAFPRYKHLPYVRVRLAWIDINEGKPQRALHMFTKLMRAGSGISPVVLRAVMHGMVHTYSQIGRPDKAFLFFKRMAPADATALAEKLARAYRSQGKWHQSIAVLRDLIRRQPRSPRVCPWQLSIARTTIAVGRPADATREAAALLKVARRMTKGYCRDRAHTEAYGAAARWHKLAQLSVHQLPLLNHALRLYRQYIQTFPRGKHIAAVRYFYANALWLSAQHQHNPRLARGAWRAASAAFRAAASTRGQLRDRRRKALRGARLAHRRARK